MKGVSLLNVLGLVAGSTTAFVGPVGNLGKRNGWRLCQAGPIQRLHGVITYDSRASSQAGVSLHKLQCFRGADFFSQFFSQKPGELSLTDGKKIEYALEQSQAMIKTLDEAKQIVVANKKFDKCEVLQTVNQCKHLVDKIEKLLFKAKVSGAFDSARPKIENVLKDYQIKVGLTDLVGDHYNRGQPFREMNEETLYGDKLIVEFAARTNTLGPSVCGTRKKMHAQRYGEIQGFLALKEMDNYAKRVLLPSGSWAETCEVSGWDGRALEATCKDSNGAMIETALVTLETEILMNDEGHLKVDPF